MNTPKWALKSVEAALLFSIVAWFVCTCHMSRVACPTCLEEFVSNGVKLDVLALEMPASDDELRGTLYLGKPFYGAVRDVYEKQTNVDDVFLWLYPAQFSMACFYLGLIGQAKLSRLLLVAASLAMMLAGWLDHNENSLIHAILRDSGAHFNALAPAVRHVSIEKWLCFGAAASLAAAWLALPMRGVGYNGLTWNATALLSATLTSTFLLVLAGWALGNRNIVGWSALAYSLFPLVLLWLLYLKPWAESIEGWLRSSLGMGRRSSSGTI